MRGRGAGWRDGGSPPGLAFPPQVPEFTPHVGTCAFDPGCLLVCPHPSFPRCPHPSSQRLGIGIFASRLIYQILFHFHSSVLSCLLPDWPFWERKCREVDTPRAVALYADLHEQRLMGRWGWGLRPSLQRLSCSGRWTRLERAGSLGMERDLKGFSSYACVALASFSPL